MLGKRRLVGYCGYPGARGQGRLGIGSLDDRVAEIEKRYANSYGKGRPILPTLELIATTVHPVSGRDGTFRTRTDPKIIERHVKAAEHHESYLLLNIQPGRANFLDEVKALEPWLVRPDVGVALDPEWAVKKGQVPGRVFGSTSGKELDGVARWLSDLVAKHHLPQKVMVYHQLHLDIVAKESALREHPGVALIKSVDGIGSRSAKTDTWTKLAKAAPDHVAMGFKLFYDEDTAGGHDLMSPSQVLALRPRPDYVMYE
ncbi:MAG TPA: hypothetical protein IAA98_05755 [Candidatus Avipropionibacterium avicola]|uniref:Uncharacterized protein n=1 Tax=Candidatus Avipropionibacterium avicola TaxID=2840701 RepID=A0A9D1GXC3_9ACTN|nr:hypothetical protein [Candidatus Avipropionibacterium avicola]